MPNNITDKFRVTREDYNFFINSTPISGVQTASISYQNTLTPLKFISQSTGIYINRGVQESSASVSAFLVNKDYFIELTGNTGFNGYLIRNVTAPEQYNFSFTSGYLTSYSTRCSIGEIPQINASFLIYGNVGQFGSGESTFVSGDFGGFVQPSIGSGINVAGYSDINLTLNDFNTNRVLSYSLEINVPRASVYKVGSRLPIAVNYNPPIEANLNFQYEIDNYSGSRMRDYPNTIKTDNVTIIINAPNTSTALATYAFSGMTLANETIDVGVDGAATINAAYRKCIL